MIRFGNGKVVDSEPALYPDYPNIPGFGPSPWFITQWKKWDHMRSNIMSQAHSSTFDPVFGLSNYSFSTYEYLSHAWFYPDPTDTVHGRRLVFELFSTGGLYDSAGGAGEHLSTWLRPAPTLNAPVVLTFNGKVKRRAAIYLDPDAEPVYAVGIWYSLVTAAYTDPDTGSVTNAFVQILHADTRDRLPARHVDFYQFYDQTPPTVNYLNLLAEDMPQYFPRASPKGALRPVQFDVAKYICDMVQTPIPRSDGTWYRFPAAARILSTWKLTSFAIGLETSDRALDASGQTVALGSAEISYQISDVHLRKYAALSATYDGCTF